MVGCASGAGDAGWAFEADEVGREALGIGAALAVRSGTTEGEVGSGDRRLAAALAVAWEIISIYLSF